MLLRPATLLVVATVLVSTARNTEALLEGVVNGVTDVVGGIVGGIVDTLNPDTQKWDRFEKYLERHKEKFEHDKFWQKIQEATDEIFPEDVPESEAYQAQSGTQSGDDTNYQRTVLKREADPQVEYRHTILSRSNSPLQLIRVDSLVDSSGTSRRKRGVKYPDSDSWPFRIPYVFDPSYSSPDNGLNAKLFTRVVNYIGQHICFTYVDETENYDPSDPNWFINNGYEINSHLLVRDTGGGCAASTGSGNQNATRNIQPCVGFSIITHEVLHTLGMSHTQTSRLRDNYITINVDNILENIISLYTNKVTDQYQEYYDANSALTYSKYTWQRNGLETYLPIRDDLFEGMGISNEEIAFKSINHVFQCAAEFCPGDTRDCGEGYLAYRNGSCQCVCPRFYNVEDDCQTMINGPSSVSWPNVPFALLKAGPNVTCPEGFDQQHGGFSHTGNWKDYQANTVPELYEAVDKTTYFQVCTKAGPSSPDWDLMPSGGEYCFIKPENVSCGYGNAGVLEFESYEDVEYYGNLGDITISGNKTAIKTCCMPDYKKQRNQEVEFPNAVPFRLFARGSCPFVQGMKSYRGMIDFYTPTKTVTGTGDETPQYYIFSMELQVITCYYQPPVYGCNEEHTLDSTNRIVTVTSPGYNVSREPDRRCFYVFHAPEQANLLLTFLDYDLLADDDVILQRYNKWQQPYRLDNNNYPLQVVSESNFLSVELWTNYMTTNKIGLSFTVEVRLGEESCYDPGQNGANYMGSTSISEVYEECMDWSEAVECWDFPYTSEGAIWLLTSETGNECRNPDGDLLGPYCYTYKNGTNCRKRYCDVCGYKDVIDVVTTCDQLMAEDPDFCNSGIQRFGCYKSCGFPVETHNTSCPEGWDRFVHTCYKYIDTPMTHADAVEHCQSYNRPGHLFQVLSEEDQQFLENLRDFLSYSSQDLWISGHFNHYVGDWTTLEGNEILVYQNFDHDPGCELDWEPSKNRCFKMILNELTANQAADYCRTLSPNGTLFRVFDEEDQLQVRQYKQDKGGDYLQGTWISGFLVAEIPGQVIGDWRYTDSDIPLSYMEWAQSEDPNNIPKRCIRMYKENYWMAGQHRALNCGWGKADFVCQVDKATDFGGKDCIYLAQNSSWLLEDCTSQVEKQFVCQISVAVECGPPTIPEDGYVTTPLKANYGVGEKVYIYCNTTSSNPPASEIVCQGESGWTQLTHACIECPLGWVPFGNSTCFKIFVEGAVTNEDAATTCRAQADSGTLFRIHDELEQQMITMYRQRKGPPYNQEVSISGQLVQKLQGQQVGQWSFHDDLANNMTYFNWSSYEDANNSSRGCIRLYSQDEDNGALADYWKSVDCGEGGGTTYFICQIDKQDVGCADNINVCEDILTSIPDFCSNPKTINLAEYYCHKSCGGCYFENQKCSTPSSSTYDRISAEATIIPGDVMEFECKPGYYHVGGDLKRACGPDGSLLGQETDCQTTPVAQDVNLHFVRRRDGTLNKKQLYLLDHPTFRIPFNGNVTKWYYYSDTPGNLYFTVFRKSGNNYNYVGSNWIWTYADWPWSYNVPSADQISVLKDDIVGIYTTDPNILFVNNCNNAPEQLIVVPFAQAQNFNIAKTITTFSNTNCLIPSFGYRVAP